MTLYLILIATLVTCVDSTYYYRRLEQGIPASRVRQIFMVWDSRAAAQNIDGLLALYTDDVEIAPPGRPPILGKVALRQYYQDILDAGTWPRDRVLTFDSFLGKCGNTLASARYTGRITRFDGTKSVTNGLRLFQKQNGMLKLKYDIWNSNGHVTPPAPAKMAPKQQPTSGQGSSSYRRQY